MLSQDIAVSVQIWYALSPPSWRCIHDEMRLLCNLVCSVFSAVYMQLMNCFLEGRGQMDGILTRQESYYYCILPMSLSTLVDSIKLEGTVWFLARNCLKCIICFCATFFFDHHCNMLTYQFDMGLWLIACTHLVYKKGLNRYGDGKQA
jgi:hypothetical protein